MYNTNTHKKTMVALIIVLSLIVTASAVTMVHADAPPTVQWSKYFGGSSTDAANSVIQTSDGGFAAAGYTYSGTGNGDGVGYLVKTDASGNLQWSKTYGGPQQSWIYSVIQTSDGGYALAGFNSNNGAGNRALWLVKTDASGTQLWSHQYNYGYGYCVIQTSDGGYILAGMTTGGAYLNGVIVKINANGVAQWNQTYGGAGTYYLYSIAQTSDGGYIACGSYAPVTGGADQAWLLKISSTGSTQWSKTFPNVGSFDAYTVIPQASNGYTLIGLAYNINTYSYNAIILNTDSSGNQQWNQTYSAITSGKAQGVQTSDGGYALVGNSASGGTIVKTDANGNLEWTTSTKGPGSETLLSIAQTTSGGYIVAGQGNGGSVIYDLAVTLFVTPEYAYGAIIALAASFSAVAVLTVVKKRNHA